MSSAPMPEKEETEIRTRLLRQVTELLMWELAAISDRKWEDLPELKRRKGLLAGELRQFDWTAGPESTESLDLLMLRSQIADLEYQSKQKLSMHLKSIRQQLEVLGQQKAGWLHCMNGYVNPNRALPTLA
jgi:hypothetical protein